jgi:hypothetical protein
MYSRVNMPGALSIGDLGSANEVRIGLGGALSVINPGSGAGQVSVVGPLSATSVNPGTGSMTCGALSAGSVTVRSGGVLRASVGSASAPALCVGTDSSVGLFSSSATLSVASAGAEWLRVGSTVETFTLLRVTGTNSALCDAVSCSALTSSSTITVSGAVSCGANPLTCGALSSGPITASGAISCAGALTCGLLSCASIASTGDITQPRYSLRVYRSASQNVGNSASTAIVWDTVETSGGGATNWTFTPGSSLITCPKDGKYLILYQVGFNNSAVGVRNTWVEINPPGGVPGSVRKHAELLIPPAASTVWVGSNGFVCQLGAGDTILVVAFQSSGGTLSVTANTTFCEFSITRLCE